MPKLPAIQFYPGDWLRDDVAGCSLAAQGLWLRMMFLMHDSERYGYLTTNGAHTPPESVARRCGCTLDQYATLFDELTAAGVPGRTPDGLIFSRRMVRDAQERAKTKERVKNHRKGKKSSNAFVTPHVTPKYEDESEDLNSSLNQREEDPRARETPSAKDTFWEPLKTLLGVNPVNPAEERELYQHCITLQAKGATVEELKSRIAFYRKKWPEMVVTLNGLMNNWDFLIPQKSTTPPIRKLA